MTVRPNPFAPPDRHETRQGEADPGLAELNKIAVALAAMAAMREHRKGKPIAFQTRTRP